jgi:hypothetical protein
MNQACKLVSGVMAGLTVRTKNARISKIKKIAVEVPSEKAFSLSTHMSDITGKKRARSLGKKIGHSKEFKEVWLLIASRFIKKEMAGKTIMRQIILTWKAESGLSTPKEWVMTE